MSPRCELLIDVAITVVIGALVANVMVGADDPKAQDIDAGGVLLGIAMVTPLLVRRRWPLVVLLVVASSLMAWYALNYPGIEPWVPLAVPVYTAALAGRMAWTVVISLVFLTGGSIAIHSEHDWGALEIIRKLAPDAVVLALAIVLAEAVRGRRALVAETRARLEAAERSREKEAERKVSEERLRIARELHDTVAHGIATITVQAGTALHLLGDEPKQVRTALTAIRQSGKETLDEMRATLGLLRQGDESDASPAGQASLDGIPALLDAVRAAGLAVDLRESGTPQPLAAETGHVAYRIVQEALTNVLRHAGPGACATVLLSHENGGLDLEVTDDGAGPVRGDGNGLRGMRERAAVVGGTLTAGPGRGGGFAVVARLPAGEGGVR